MEIEASGHVAQALASLKSAAISLQTPTSADEAVAAWDRVGDLATVVGDEAAVLDVLEGVVGAWAIASRWKECLAACDRALPLLPAPRRALVLDAKKAAASNLGDYDTAAQVAGLQAEQARAAGDLASEVAALASLGCSLRFGGHVDEAAALAERTLSLASRLGDSLREVSARSDVATLLLSLGRAAPALPGLLAAADACERSDLLTWCYETTNKTLDPSTKIDPRTMRLLEDVRISDLVAMLQLVAKAHLMCGDSQAAVATARRAVAAATTAATRAQAWMSVGNAHLAQLDMGSALDAIERAAGFAEHSDDEHDLAMALNLLAVTLSEVGEKSRALAAQQRVVSIYRSSNRGALSLPAALRNLALIQADLGAADAAESSAREAVKSVRAINYPPEEASARNTLGTILNQVGREDEARAEFEAALEIYEAGDDSTGAAYPLLNLACFPRVKRRFEESLPLALRALERSSPLSEARYLALIQVGNDTLELGRAPLAVERLREAARLLGLRFDRLAEEEAARAREEHLGLYRLGLAAAQRAGSAEDALFFLESSRARSLLVGLGGRKLLRQAVLPEPLRRLETEAIEREAHARRAFDEAAAAGRRAEMQHWRKAIDAARTAIEGVTARIQREGRVGAGLYCPEPVALGDLQPQLGADEAMVLFGETRTGHVALVLTRDSARLVAVPPREESRPDLLVAALDLVPSIRRVLLSPPVALTLHPWCREFQGRELCYVPSATVWSMLRGSRGSRGERILALGNPQYAPGTLTPLPASGDEAQAIGDATLLGERATKPGLFAALASQPRWRAIHLACHATADRDKPLFGSLLLAPSGSDDGKLTVRDLLQLPLPADLVVLSACETGQGASRAGEGLFGFTRALLFAGASSVIVSLWKADDDATRALMVRFYELWKDRPAARALQEAQEFVRAQEKWKDPKYWAAWQLWGLGD